MSANKTKDAPASVIQDGTHPAAVRVYDWYLGGSSNFAVDRKFGKRTLEIFPMARQSAVANRDFLRRVVTWLSRKGIDQFLDIGSGVPTNGNVHEVAQRLNPYARTVYVDNDYLAVTHANRVLDDSEEVFSDPRRERTVVVQADFLEPQAILDHPHTRRLLDFDRPIAVLGIALLPLIGPEHNVTGLLARYRERLVSGSYLAMTQLTDDGIPAEMVDQIREFVEVYGATPNPIWLRGRPEFTGFFSGWELTDPGVVWTPQWHPDSELEHDPTRSVFLAGVGRKV